MNLLLTTKCYSNCKFCFVPKEMKKEQTEMSFLQFKKYIDHINKLYKTNKPVIGILGGEPTLAKDFSMIIGYAKSYSGGIRLYSSLITDTKNIEYLLGAKNIVLSWNIDAYKQANKINKKLILKNLKLIKKDLKNNVLASITLYANFQIKDFYEIIKILQKYNVNNIRIALDSTNYQSFINYGTEIFEFVKYLKKLKFNLFSSACGHFIKDIFTEKQETFIKNNISNFKYNDCSTNFPLDVLPNGTVVPCVSFCNRNKNIRFLEYNSLNKLKQKITKEYNLVECQTEYCMANNKFNVVVGFTPYDTIEFLKQNNIKEVYCGYYDKNLEKKWPVSFGCINRRGEGVNFSSWTDLIKFTKSAYKNNIKVYFTLNSHYYVKEQYSWLKQLITKIKKENSITGIILNDLGLLLMINQMKFNKDITISTLATAFNSNAINFYKQFGANRIVLDRQFTPKEIMELANSHKDMEFEIFVLSTGGCLFIDGYCSLFHCFEQLKEQKDFGEMIKAKKYDLVTAGAGCCTVLNNFSGKDFNVLSTNKQKFEISKTLGFSCNICMLYELRNIKNLALKIDNRGSNGLGVTNINMLNELVSAVNSSIDKEEYIKKAKEILYKYKKVKCNSKLCLYYKDK